MSTFFVPCVKCVNEPHHFLHTPAPDHVTCFEAAMHHDYRPDETSAEWAAVKMREALQGCRDWVVNCPDMRDGSGTAASQQRYVLAEIDAVLALADAAGIRDEGGNHAS